MDDKKKIVDCKGAVLKTSLLQKQAETFPHVTLMNYIEDSVEESNYEESKDPVIAFFKRPTPHKVRVSVDDIDFMMGHIGKKIESVRDGMGVMSAARLKAYAIASYRLARTFGLLETN